MAWFAETWHRNTTLRRVSSGRNLCRSRWSTVLELGFFRISQSGICLGTSFPARKRLTCGGLTERMTGSPCLEHHWTILETGRWMFTKGVCYVFSRLHLTSMAALCMSYFLSAPHSPVETRCQPINQSVSPSHLYMYMYTCTYVCNIMLCMYACMHASLLYFVFID